MTPAHAEALRELRSARIDAAAERCITLTELGDAPPPARLAVVDRVDGRRLKVEVLWDPDAGDAFERLPAAETEGTMPLDPWVIEQLDHFIALHEVEVEGLAARALAELRAEHDEALVRIRSSRATEAEPIAGGRRGARRRAASRSSGPACATCWTRAARSSPTSRASARRSRRSPRWRPTTPSRRSSSARRR